MYHSWKMNNLSLCFPESVKITIGIGGQRGIPFFQSEMGNWFTVGTKSYTHGHTSFCLKADPADTVFVCHRMRSFSNFDSDMTAIGFYDRQVFFGSTACGTRFQNVNGRKLSGRAVLGVPQIASKTISRSLSVRKTGSLFMRNLLW